MKFIKKLLTDERGSLSTKRIIAIISALFICVTLLVNSFSHQEIGPSDKLVDAVMVICCVAMGATTFDKFSFKEKAEDASSEENV
jgi:hypothetical protein